MPILLVFLLLLSPAADAKKKKAAEGPTVPLAKNAQVARRLGAMNAEDKRFFDSLSDEQKELISQGKVQEGFNEWMVRMALGEPFYATEHHPIYVDYEQVWLYTRPDVVEQVKEEKIIDPQTNWPTVHRTTRKKTCNVTDFFVLWDRGVLLKTVATNDKKQYGSCTEETTEAFLPIVNGKPVEPKTSSSH